MNAIVLHTLSNTEAMLKDLRGKLTSLGAAEGKGSSSRPHAALRLVQAAADGLIVEDDASEMFGAYALGVANAAKNNPLVTSIGNAEQKSSTQQISKFRAFIRVGMLPTIDPMAVMGRAASLTKSLSDSGTKTYSPFDALLSVAREQTKSPQAELTDEQITAIVTKPEPRDKDEIEKLVDAYKRACTLAEKIPSPHTEAAVSAYGDAIVEAGGELPPRTKEEKDMAAFMAKAAKLGLSFGRAAE